MLVQAIRDLIDAKVAQALNAARDIEYDDGVHEMVRVTEAEKALEHELEVFQQQTVRLGQGQ